MGGGTVPTAEKPEPTPAPKAKKADPAPQVSDEDRAKRSSDAEADQRKVLAFVREHGEITYAQAAELLGCSHDTARRRLLSIVRTTDLKSATGTRAPGEHGRPPVVFRLNATGSTTDDGPKTSVERRVVDSVTTDGPIDEGTLAFNCNLSITDCRSVTSGLVRRGVLTKREEEGVTLFEADPEEIVCLSTGRAA